MHFYEVQTLVPDAMPRIIRATGPGSAAREGCKRDTGRIHPLPTPQYPEHGGWKYVAIGYPDIHVRQLEAIDPTTGYPTTGKD